MTQDIEIKVQDGVQVIRFLRADKKNAFTGPMYNAMSEALDASETNDAIACHVFIGSGGIFSAGNDINDFMRRAQATADQRRQGHPGPFARLHPPPAQGDQADDRGGRRARHRRRHHHAAALRPGVCLAHGQPAHAVPRSGADPGSGVHHHGARAHGLSARLRDDLPGRAVQRRAGAAGRADQCRRAGRPARSHRPQGRQAARRQAAAGAHDLAPAAAQESRGRSAP